MNEHPSPALQEMPRHVRIGFLLDLYGPLLTQRQREFVLLHYNEDQSFGEIAKTYGVSRQAVHDAVKHAERSLDEYESKLRLMERGIPRLLQRLETEPLPEDSGPDAAEDGAQSALEASAEAIELDFRAAAPGTAGGARAAQPSSPGQAERGDPERLRRLAEGLREIRRRIHRSGGIIYDAEGLAAEVGRLLADVEDGLGGAGRPAAE